MRRVPDGATLDRRLEEGEADAETAAAIAHRLARFHAQAKVVSGAGHPAGVRRTLDETLETLLELSPPAAPRAHVEA